VVKGLHLVVGLFAENEKSDFMVGVDFIDAVDIGRDELENEHDIVSLVDILLLVLLNSS
jgi:hypothetical protein